MSTVLRKASKKRSTRVLHQGLTMVMCNKRTSVGVKMSVLLRLDALARIFVSMCASLFPFMEHGRREDSPHPALCDESASEIMRWGSLINCSGEAAATAHRINLKGPGSNVNQRDSALGTLMTHARRKETARLMGSAIDP